MISNMTIKPKQVLPAFHYPTTIMLVDDDVRLLKSISLSLSKYFLFALYDNAKDVLTFFNEYYKPSLSIMQCFDKTNDNRLKLNLTKLLSIIYNPNRFKEIACVITDYAMPYMNGLEFIKQIPTRAGFEPNIRKIMLTGEAEFSIALQAFRDQLISAFYKKSDDYTPELIEKIQTIQRYYFEDATLKIAISLRDDPINRSIALIDNQFIDFFKEHLYKKDICEYYLIDKQGSFLLLNAYGEISYFLTKNDLGMENDLAFAKQHHAPATVINTLAAKSHLLFMPLFNEDEPADLSITDWDKLLHPVKIFDGAEKYYYCITDQSVCQIDKSKVLSLVDYRESLSQ